MYCSAQRHKPTHHLPRTVLALPHMWYPDSYIPLFTLHCKTSPVNKQVVSATVHIWRGSVGLWRRTGRSSRPREGGSAVYEQPRWQQAEGAAVLQPGSATCGMAGQWDQASASPKAKPSRWSAGSHRNHPHAPRGTCGVPRLVPSTL